MTWPSKIIRQFRRIPDNASQADIHGPYNKLLCSLFPAHTDYTVFPRYEPVSEDEPIQFFFDVHFDNKPMFTLEHKTPGEFKYGSKRDNADRQIRDHMQTNKDRLGHHFQCTMPVLHGVSAFGTRLCFYKLYPDETVEPSLAPCHPECVTGTAPEERWDCDILQEEGEKKFKSMVEEIKKACAVL